MAQVSPFPINELPEELQVVISTFLPVTDVCNLSATSRHWHEITQDNDIWLRKCREDFPHIPFPPDLQIPQGSAKLVYRHLCDSAQHSFGEWGIVRFMGMLIIRNRIKPAGVVVALPQDNDGSFYVQVGRDQNDCAQFRTASDGTYTRCAPRSGFMMPEMSQMMWDKAPPLPATMKFYGFELRQAEENAEQVLHISHPHRSGFSLKLMASSNGWMYATSGKERPREMWSADYVDGVLYPSNHPACDHLMPRRCSHPACTYCQQITLQAQARLAAGVRKC